MRLGVFWRIPALAGLRNPGFCCAPPDHRHSPTALTGISAASPGGGLCTVRIDFGLRNVWTASPPEMPHRSRGTGWLDPRDRCECDRHQTGMPILDAVDLGAADQLPGTCFQYAPFRAQQ